MHMLVAQLSLAQASWGIADMDAAVATSVSKLKTLRLQLKAMERQARRAHRSTNHVLTPTTMLKLRVVLLFALCGTMQWAMLWAMWFRRKQQSKYGTWQQPLSEMMITAWTTEYQEHPLVLSSIQRMDHPWRVAADTWLVESLVYEDVLSTNKRGLVVPSDDMARWYQRKWALRPCSAATNTHLDRMRRDPRYARLRAGRFRRRWNLVWDKMREARGLNPEEAFRRVAIYMRWLQWTVQQTRAGVPVVIVAMDETSMSSVSATGHGTVVLDSDQHAMEQPIRTAHKKT